MTFNMVAKDHFTIEYHPKDTLKINVFLYN